MVVLISVVQVVYEIMWRGLNGISKHVELFESDRPTVYIERLFGIGGFAFLLSVLAVFYSKGIVTIRIAPTVVLC